MSELFEHRQDDLELLLSQHARGPVGWQEPTQYDFAQESDRSDAVERIRQGRITAVIDGVDLIAQELFELENPTHKDDVARREQYVSAVKSQGAAFGKWIEFHDTGELVRYPDVNDYRNLRTSRFKHLVTEFEQGDLYDARTATYGQSVGSSIVESQLMAGVGGTQIIGDFDKLMPSNLGRIRSDIRYIGEDKLDLTAQKLSHLDPYVKQVHHREGFTDDVVEELAELRPQVMFDAVDDMRAKARMRQVAQQLGIALVMATDLGDRSVIDVERYDLDKGTKPFHGKLSATQMDALIEGSMPETEMKSIPAKILGLRHVTTRMLQSVMEVGKTLPGIPQLGTTATMGGVLATLTAREIILGNKMETGRYVSNPKEILNMQPQSTVPQALHTVTSFVRSQRSK